MKRSIIVALVTLGVGVSLVMPVRAKGPTVKLTVTGPGLDQPLEITEPGAIAANVWHGNFINWQEGPALEPAQSFPRYMIQFHVVPPRSEVKMMYVVYCVWDEGAGRVLVYLPGRGEDWYRLNVSTILRSGQDGKWHYASDEWSLAIRSALE